MFVTTGLLLALVAGASASCSKDPDGTNEQIYYEPCNTQDALIVNSFRIVKDDGSNDYPVCLTQPVNLIVNLTNTAQTAFDNIRVSASVARYTDVFGFCSWISVPTFGLLDNLDGCHLGTSVVCPVQPGNQLLSDHVDLTKYQSIINLLNDGEPYRVQLTFSSADGAEIACAKVEAKITKSC